MRCRRFNRMRSACVWLYVCSHKRNLPVCDVASGMRVVVQAEEASANTRYYSYHNSGAHTVRNELHVHFDPRGEALPCPMLLFTRYFGSRVGSSVQKVKTYYAWWKTHSMSANKGEQVLVAPLVRIEGAGASVHQAFEHGRFAIPHRGPWPLMV